MQYNGWTNKETWLVNLWVGDGLAEMQGEGTEVTAQTVKAIVIDWLDYAHGNDVESGFLVDLLNCALDSINWEEVASHYKND
jgi:hypothetical protein